MKTEDTREAWLETKKRFRFFVNPEGRVYLIIKGCDYTGMSADDVAEWYLEMNERYN